ncbi:UNKNOWN [Stylonychia lemnae]|uniref:Uncharacterized protein n=1 Tax=Stylonychia lemnae TaxID=5949 RepID=A0A078BBA1_STYLE|nr:UNKNOWN [Stylonychia lemnae]|eukprot:CDW90843.1 UNKNOWN [Stylonychia lemnae]
MSEGQHHGGVAHHTTNNFDNNYQQHFRETFNKQGRKTPVLIGYRAENQYIWVYGYNSFITGAYYGAFIGIPYSVFHRKLSLIPKYAAGFGALYAAFSASSAYFRNEI